MFLIAVIPFINGFIPVFNSVYLRKNIMYRPAIFTSYNPMENNNNVTKRFMIIIPDTNNTLIKPGYPKEAFRNITYPSINEEIDDEIVFNFVIYSSPRFEILRKIEPWNQESQNS